MAAQLSTVSFDHRNKNKLCSTQESRQSPPFNIDPHGIYHHVSAYTTTKIPQTERRQSLGAAAVSLANIILFFLGHQKEKACIRAYIQFSPRVSNLLLLLGTYSKMEIMHREQ